MLSALLALLLAAPVTFEEASARARAAQQAEDLDGAIEAYREALEVQPDWAEGWWALGGIFYAQDRFPECQAAFGSLTDLAPKAGPGWAFRGLCEFRNAAYKEARRSLERAASLGVPRESGSLEVVQFHLGVLRNADGDFEMGMEVLRALAANSEPKPELLLALGQSLLRVAALPGEVDESDKGRILLAGRGAYETAVRRGDQARRTLDELVARYPTSPNVHYAYGSYVLAADADLAVKHFREELNVSSGHVPARLQLAYEYLKRGEQDAGLPYAAEAVALEPENFAARHVYGRLLFAADQLEKAVAELEIAAQLAPDSPQTRFALARAYARIGRSEDAARERAEFQRLEELKPNR